MKRRLYFLYFLLNLACCQSLSLSAQSILSDQLVSDQLVKMPLRSGGKPGEYEGSPFLTDSFQTGQIVLTAGSKFSLPMRFNVYQDILEIKYKGRDMQIQPNDLILRIELDVHTLVVNAYELDGNKRRGFLFLLDSGDITLFQKRNISFKEWRPAKAMESAPSPATFKSSPDQYFARLTNGTTVYLNSIKSLASVFPNHQNAINTFIKKEKIKLKKEDLLTLFAYYRSQGD